MSTWPSWIEQLREAYLANEASVFLLHGAVGTGRWEVEGEAVDCVTTLVRFLLRSREIIGVYDPVTGLSFHTPMDRSRFKSHTEARQVLDGQVKRLSEDDTDECLALLYQALTTPGARQGYLLLQADKLAPFGSTGGRPLPAGAPGLDGWAMDPVLRATDNVVILLTDRLERVRAELDDGVGITLIEVPDDRVAAAAPTAPVSPSDADPSLAPEETPSNTDRLAARLADALRAGVDRHPGGDWIDAHPAREALAEVLAEEAPARFGPIVITATESGLVATGPGADAFSAWLRRDIAALASAEQALASMPPDGVPDPKAARALARRVEKLLQEA